MKNNLTPSHLRPILNRIKTDVDLKDIPHGLLPEPTLKFKLYEHVKKYGKKSTLELDKAFPTGGNRHMRRTLHDMVNNGLFKTSQCTCYEKCPLVYYEVVKNVRTRT